MRTEGRLFHEELDWRICVKAEATDGSEVMSHS